MTRVTFRAALGSMILIAATAIGSVATAQNVAGPYLAARNAETRGDVAVAARLYTRISAREPENTFLMERAMINQIAAGNVPAGLALARRHHALEPNHHLGVLALAVDHLLKEDPDAALEVLPESSAFIGSVIRAWAEFDRRETRAALDQLKALGDSDQNGAAAQVFAAYHTGLISAAAGDDESAIAAFETASRLTEGGTLRLVAHHARALARLGRTEDALALIDKRLETTFGDAGLDRLRRQIVADEPLPAMVDSGSLGAAEILHGVSGLLLRGRGAQIGLAYARLAVHLNPDLSEAKLLIAQILDREEQYDLAIAAYEAIEDKDPEALTAKIGRAQALQAADRVDEAVDAMEETIALFPDSLDARRALGDMLRRESRFEEAGEAYDAAIALLEQIEPKHWALFYQRGITFERSKQWDKAEADFRHALRLHPDQADVLNYLGYSLVELGQKLGEAEAMIEKAVEQRPNDGYIVDSLGWVLYRFGEFDRAVEHLGRAVELRPVDPVINDHFGDALWMVGRRTEARFQWKRALSFEPDESDAERIRRKLADGLDTVLAEDEEKGLPGIIGRAADDTATDTDKNGG